MKKIFTTLAVAAITVASARAEQPMTAVQNQLNASIGSQKALSLNEKEQASTVRKVRGFKLEKKNSENFTSNRKSPRKAAESEGISGTYTITIGDFYNGQNSIGAYTADCTVTQDGTQLTFSCDEFMSDIVAQYNEATGAISFSPLYVGYNSRYEDYVFFRPFYWDNDLETVVFNDKLVVSYNSEKGTITFPSDNGFAWDGYTDQTMTTSTGLYLLFDVLGLTVKQSAEEPEEPKEQGVTKAYINYYEPYFSNWDASKRITQVVYVTYYDDNSVEIDGLGGFGVKTNAGNSSYTNITNLSGTYDPEAKTITIPARQTLGTYGGQYTITCFTGLKGSTSLYYGEMVFKETEDGQLVLDCNYDLYYIGAMKSGALAGALGGMYSPILKPANGTISYTYSANISGKVEEPCYYEIATIDGKKYLRTSNLANRAGEGYEVIWEIDEDTQTATATNAATYNNADYGDYILQSSENGTTADLTTAVVANISDPTAITFPSKGYWTCLTESLSYFGWNTPATISGTPIYVNETYVPDYSLTVSSSDACFSGETYSANLKFGEDIASIKYSTINNVVPILPDYVDIIDSSSRIEQVAPSAVINGDIYAEGVYTLLVVGYNADGNIQATSATHFIALPEDDAENWEEMEGDATFTENFYGSLFSDIDPETITVKVEKNTAEEGLYRIVNPYASHSFLKGYYTDKHDHNHYITINATNPEKVYVHGSATGVDLTGFGGSLISSDVYDFMQFGYEVEDFEDEQFGSKSDNVITVSPESTYFSFCNEPYNEPLYAGFTVTLPEEENGGTGSGIKEINAAADEDAVYYNLRGQRIAAPTAPGFYIRNNQKILVK